MIHCFNDHYKISYIKDIEKTKAKKSKGSAFEIEFKNLRNKRLIKTHIGNNLNGKYNGWRELYCIHQLVGDRIVYSFQPEMFNRVTNKRTPWELFYWYNEERINGDSVVYPAGHLVIDTQLNHLDSTGKRVKNEDTFFSWDVEDDIQAVERVEPFSRGWNSVELEKIISQAEVA
jgi:hypothetical protein